MNGTVLVVVLGLALALFVAVYFLIPGWLRSRRAGVSSNSSIARHRNSVIIEGIIESNDHLRQAESDLAEAESQLVAAKSAAAAAQPRDPVLDDKVRLAAEEVAKQGETVRLKQEGRDQALSLGHPPGILDQIEWGTVLQYAIFSALALVVLLHLMDGLTSTPPAGTTPRGMITFLIAVVTVGIALILVLSTVVSNSDDREKRFSQGKEVLTALLGVLGTIVGFYFGTSQDATGSLDFDPVVITMKGDNSIDLTTSIRGGKGPYKYEVAFTPNTIPPVKRETPSGLIEVSIPSGAEAKGNVSFRISATDSDGRTGTLERKNALHIDAEDNGKAGK